MEKKEQTRLRVQRYREKKALHDSVTPLTPDSVTALPSSVTRSDNNVTQYPAIVHALTDPGKREKLEKICSSLKDHGMLKEVRYGIDGPTFDIVGEMLTIVK